MSAPGHYLHDRAQPRGGGANREPRNSSLRDGRVLHPRGAEGLEQAAGGHHGAVVDTDPKAFTGDKERFIDAPVSVGWVAGRCA